MESRRASKAAEFNPDDCIQKLIADCLLAVPL
jgi:hypothetical protein